MKNTALIIALSLFINIAMAQGDHKQKYGVGDNAPSFTGIDQYEQEISSEEVLQKGPIVLVFYRGTWCPYCKKHVSALQNSLEEFTKLGASIVVVTPEQSEFVDKMVKKTDASFSIIHDKDYVIMKAFGLDFKISKETVPSYYNYVLNGTREANGNEDDILPIPATYVINTQGTIDYTHFDPNYKNRSSMEDILTHLKPKQANAED